MSRTVPKQKPHRSEQTVSTPWSLIKAIEYRFGKLQWDLAASHDNAKAPNFITQKSHNAQDNLLVADSLTVDWHRLEPTGLLYLNCPFGDIAPWAKKCYEESQKGAKIFLLTPLTCSKWHSDWIYGKAYIMALTPRITFENHTTAFPKDLQLAFFNSGIRGNEIWRWTETLKKHENQGH